MASWPEATNPYTSITVAQLYESQSRLAAAQKSRRENYASELTMWRENDAACKTFADQATPLHESIAVMMQQLAPQSMDEDAQLASVTTVLDECTKTAYKLA